MVSNVYRQALFNDQLHQHPLKSPPGKAMGKICSLRQSLQAARSSLNFCCYFQQLLNVQSALGSCGETQKNLIINIYIGCLMLMASLKTAAKDVDVTDPTE